MESDIVYETRSGKSPRIDVSESVRTSSACEDGFIRGPRNGVVRRIQLEHVDGGRSLRLREFHDTMAHLRPQPGVHRGMSSSERHPTFNIITVDVGFRNECFRE